MVIASETQRIGLTRWPSPSPTFAGQLDGFSALDAAGHDAIDRRSAEVLFPQFADARKEEN